MKHDIEKLKEAASKGGGQRNVKMVFDAIDELEALRARVAELASTSPVPGLSDSGPYTLADVEAIEAHRGEPYARLRETVEAFDAAKAREAELLARTETLAAEVELRRGLAESELRAIQALDAARADAARLRGALVAFLEVSRCSNGCPPDDMTCATSRADAALAATSSAEWLAKHDAEVRAPLEKQANGREKALRALVDSLRSQLVAATNDAARAELRAKELEAIESAQETK